MLVAFFLRNPTEAFNAHIDAPVEAELVKLQAEVEGGIESEGAPSTAEKQAHHTASTTASA